jgi:hypothetical protein
VRAPALEGGGVFLRPPHLRQRTWQGPCRRRLGRQSREADFPRAATRRSAPPGDPRCVPAALGPEAGRQASPQTASSALSAEPPRPEGRRRQLPAASWKTRGFSWILQRSWHGPEGPGQEPEGPRSTRPLEAPEGVSRPTGPPLPRREEGGNHRKAEGADARQSPSGPTAGARDRRRPPDRPASTEVDPSASPNRGPPVSSPRSPGSPPRDPPLEPGAAPGRSLSRHPAFAGGSRLADVPALSRARTALPSRRFRARRKSAKL